MTVPLNSEAIDDIINMFTELLMIVVVVAVVVLKVIARVLYVTDVFVEVILNTLADTVIDVLSVMGVDLFVRVDVSMCSDPVDMMP